MQLENKHTLFSKFLDSCQTLHESKLANTLLMSMLECKAVVTAEVSNE